MKLDNVVSVRRGKTIYRDGDECIKVFNEGYSKTDILNEALNLARLEETSLNVPKLLGVTVIDGKWAIISEYVEGKDLACLMREHPSKTDEYLKLFVDLQCKVHALSHPILTRFKDKMERKFSIADLDAVTLYDLYQRLDAIPKQNKVCHGDFIPSNVMISTDGAPYILDWSHVTQGNVAVDIARTYLVFRMRANDDMGEKYLELICQQSGVSKQSVLDCMPIVAAEELIKGNGRHTEFLQNLIDGIE